MRTVTLQRVVVSITLALALTSSAAAQNQTPAPAKEIPVTTGDKVRIAEPVAILLERAIAQCLMTAESELPDGMKPMYVNQACIAMNINMLHIYLSYLEKCAGTLSPKECGRIQGAKEIAEHFFASNVAGLDIYTITE